MQIWRAHGRYRRQRAWRVLCALFFGVLLVYHLSVHHWVVVGQIALAWWLMYWGAPRLLRLAIGGVGDGARWAGRKAWALGRAQWQTYQARRKA